MHDSCMILFRVSKKEEEGFAGDERVGLFYVGRKLHWLGSVSMGG